MSGTAGFRDPRYAEAITKEIKFRAKGKQLRIIHVCGTHEDTISQHGLRALLPEGLNLVAGPGCPVCVCAAEDVDMAIELARQGHIIATFGDMFQVPSTKSSLAKERVKGADVRIVYGVSEAVEISKKNPEKEVVFIGAGFETTAPTMALELIRRPPSNFSILTSLKVIPPAMDLLVDIEGFDVDGFITPGHVAAIVGTNAFQSFAEKTKTPCVAAGFEPLDVLEAIRMILVQLDEGRADSENEYTRVVRPEGNIAAQKVLNQAFRIDDAPWRGLGIIPKSGYFIRKEFAEHDARVKFDFPEIESIDLLPGCRCHEVILGMVDPVDCKLFGKRCTPMDPYGPCMVGHEGTCRIRYENVDV
ncbi:hydrogenase formation protein HypD [Candidatus Thorarchaeota archaeon]|nr:MAG: hydrogenase formation protein HypD [Candidatus Thorarchaeota archaeon]